MSKRVVFTAKANFNGNDINSISSVRINHNERALFGSVHFTAGGNKKANVNDTGEVQVNIKYGDFGQFLSSKFDNILLKKVNQRITGTQAECNYGGRISFGANTGDIESKLNQYTPTTIYFIPEAFIKDIKEILNLRGMAVDWTNIKIQNGYLMFKFTSPQIPQPIEVPIDIGFSFENDGIVKRANHIEEILKVIEERTGLTVEIDSSLSFPLQFIETWKKGQTAYEVIRRLFSNFKPLIFIEDGKLIITSPSPRGEISIPPNLIFGISTDHSTKNISNIRVIGKPEIKKKLAITIPNLDRIDRGKEENIENLSFSRTVGDTTYKYEYIINNDTGEYYPISEEIIVFGDSGVSSISKKKYEYNSNFELEKKTEENWGLLYGELQKIEEKTTTRTKDSSMGVWLTSTKTQGYVVAHHIDGEDKYKIEYRQAVRTHSFDETKTSTDVIRWEDIAEETESVQQVSDKFAIKTNCRKEYLTNTVEYSDSIIPIVKTNKEEEGANITIGLNLTREIFNFDGTDKSSPPVEIDFIHCDEALASKLADLYTKYEYMQSNQIKIKTIFLPNVKIGMGVSISSDSTDLLELNEGVSLEEIRILKMTYQNLIITAFRHSIDQNGAFTELIIRAF